jgi:hypothetical protein
MLANAYLYRYLTWMGDRHGIWYDTPELAPAGHG